MIANSYTTADSSFWLHDVTWPISSHRPSHSSENFLFKSVYDIDIDIDFNHSAACGVPYSIHVPNFMEIRQLAAPLLAIQQFLARFFLGGGVKTVQFCCQSWVGCIKFEEDIHVGQSLSLPIHVFNSELLHHFETRAPKVDFFNPVTIRGGKRELDKMS